MKKERKKQTGWEKIWEEVQGYILYNTIPVIILVYLTSTTQNRIVLMMLGKIAPLHKPYQAHLILEKTRKAFVTQI